MTYLDITNQITIPDGSPIYAPIAYVQNGIVVVKVTMPANTVADGYYANISKEYAPIETVGGVPVAFSSRNDIGSVGGYINNLGGIIFNTKANLVGGVSITFTYPLKM